MDRSRDSESGGGEDGPDEFVASMLWTIYIVGFLSYFCCCGFGRVYSNAHRRSTSCLARCACCARFMPSHIQTTRCETLNRCCSRLLLLVATHLIALVSALACAPLWPVLAVFGLHRMCPGFYHLLCRCPPCSLVNSLARRAKRARLDAYLRREEVLHRLRTCPRESKWRQRGWLVILRARHQAFLIQQQRTGGARPRVRIRVRRQPGRCLPRVRFRLMGDPLETKRDSARSVADVDLCEEGRTNREFERIIVSVVDIQEEGLFRGIIMYL